MDVNNKDTQPNNPLHGVSLKTILEVLIDKHGWEKLASLIPIDCFTKKPSLKSSLIFLRRTPWAREKVEKLYLRSAGKKKRMFWD